MNCVAITQIRRDLAVGVDPAGAWTQQLITHPPAHADLTRISVTTRTQAFKTYPTLKMVILPMDINGEMTALHTAYQVRA